MSSIVVSVFLLQTYLLGNTIINGVLLTSSYVPFFFRLLAYCFITGNYRILYSFFLTTCLQFFRIVLFSTVLRSCLTLSVQSTSFRGYVSSYGSQQVKWKPYILPFCNVLQYLTNFYVVLLFSYNNTPCSFYGIGIRYQEQVNRIGASQLILAVL